LSWSGSSSGALRSSGTCTRGERWGEAACGAPFYSCILCRGNVDLRKERGKEVTARLGTVVERECARMAQSATRAATVGLVWRRRGREFCPYIGGEEVSWTGGEPTRPRGTHGSASAPWLCGYARAPAGLCQGLDGVLSAVSARPAGQAV
jgi:hypothetical protein